MQDRFPALSMNFSPILCIRHETKYWFFSEFIHVHNTIYIANQSRELKIPVLVTDAIADRAIEVISWRYMIMMTVMYAHSLSNAKLATVYHVLQQEVPETVQKIIFEEKITKTVLARFLGVTLRRIYYSSSEYSLAKNLPLKNFDELAAIARARREIIRNN